MADEIILSSAVRANLLSLQKTATLLGKTQQRLATGLKVNSALDDPAAFFTAASLNARASDLNRLLDSVGLAVQTIEAADTGISAITDLMEAAQAAVRQALQAAGPVTPVTPATVTGTVDLGIDVAATTTGTVNLGTDVAANFAGAGSTADLTVGATVIANTGVLTVNGSTFAITGGVTTVTNLTTFLGTLSAGVGVTGSIVGGEIDLTGDVNTTTITATLTGGAALEAELGIGATQTALPTNATIAAITGAATIQIGTNAQVTLDFNSAITNRQQLETALAGVTGGTAIINGSNFLQIDAANTTDSIAIAGVADTALGLPDNATLDPTNATIAALTGTATIQIGANAALTLDFDTAISNRTQLEAALAGLAGGTAVLDASNFLQIDATNDTDSITTGGVADTGLGLPDNTATAPVTGLPINSAARIALEGQFNDLLTQIDFLANDTGFNGINLLQSDNLKVIFNEDASSSLTITGVDFDSSGLGITAATVGDFQIDTFLDNALLQLETAVKTLRTQASTFGSNLAVVEIRQDFTKELVNVLETGATNLTIADSNEEGANLLSLQTRQQLSTVALSLATEAEQNVLRLF